MSNKLRGLSALVSCAFFLLQPFSMAAFAELIPQQTDPAALPSPTTGSPSPTPTVPSLSTVITPEIANLLAPSGNQQQTILDIAQHGGTLTFSGDFVNNNNLHIISTSSQYLTANIFATGNIINAANASISTLVPTGYSGAVPGLNLVLSAGSNIINAGTITSAGSLSMNAGNSIINMIAPQAPSVAPMMQAQTDISMQAASIINQGIVQSALANINLASMVNTLDINALGGSFSAVNGVINVATPDVLSNGVLNILSGDFISKSLNLQSGALNVAANSIVGSLNVDAGSASVSCNSGNLTIGNFHVSGESSNSLNSFSAFTGEAKTPHTYTTKTVTCFL